MWIVGFLLAYVGLWLLIALHELGHYVAARLSGMVVEEFRVGAAPDIWRQTLRSGVRVRFGALPFIGWVKTAEHSFRQSSRTRRVGMVLAGPFISIVAGLAFASIPAVLDASWMFSTLRIDAIRRDSIAHRAGFRVGDTLTAIADESITDWQQVPWKIGNALSGHLSTSLTAEGKVKVDATGSEVVEWIPPSETLQCTVVREGKQLNLDLTPYLTELRQVFPAPAIRSYTGAHVDLRHLGLLPVGPAESVELGRVTGRTLKDEISWRGTRLGTVWSFQGFQDWLLPGWRIPHLGSPVFSYGAIGPFTCLGFSMVTGPCFFLMTLGYCSVALGISNLLPLPPLDGGVALRELFRKSSTATARKELEEQSSAPYIHDVCAIIGTVLILGLLLIGVALDLRLLMVWIWW